MKKCTFIPKLSTLCVCLTFVAATALQAQVPHKKEAFPQLSSDQYQRVAALHPDTSTAVFVIVKLHVARGDVGHIDLVNSCGVPDVDQLVLKWVWNTYHYERNFSGEKTEKVRVNSPIVQSPSVRLSWRAWQQVYNADPLNQGKKFVARFNIVIREGKITEVRLVQSSGLPLVDQEFADFIRNRWVAAPGANQNYPAIMTAHRGYYPD